MSEIKEVVLKKILHEIERSIIALKPYFKTTKTDTLADLNITSTPKSQDYWTPIAELLSEAEMLSLCFDMLHDVNFCEYEQ